MLESNIRTHTEASTQGAGRTAAAEESGVRSMRRVRVVGSDKKLFVAGLLLVDAVALVTAFALAYWLRFSVEVTVAPGITPPAGVYAPLVTALIPIWLLLFAAFGLYSMGSLLGGLGEYGRILNACTWGMMVVVIATFAFPDLPQISRGWLVMAWVLAGLLVCVGRFGARRVAYAARAKGHFVAPALIIGANQEAAALVEQFSSARNCGLAVRGVMAASPADEDAARRMGIPFLGSIETLGRTLEQQNIREVIVASSALTERELLQITQKIAQHPHVSLRLSSGLYEVLTTGMRVTTIGSVPLMTVNRLRLTTGETVLKGLVDFALILVTLPLHLPLFLLIALLIKLDSRGPVFHRRRVVGVGGHEFDAFKFRTMHVDGDAILAAHPDLQEQLARDHKLKDDPRITRMGRYLRKVSLDELPQLINVLLGQMSLVGPRMVHPSEVTKYGRMKDNLFTVKPGLTGMWQVSGRSDLSYDERVRLDMLYIRNYSLWLDMQILFVQTLPAVVRGHGAY